MPVLLTILVLLLVAVIIVGGPVVLTILDDIWLAFTERRNRRTDPQPNSTAAQPPPPVQPFDSQAIPVGAPAASITALKPFGIVAIDGEPHRARSDLGYIAPGKAVRVLGREADVLIVRELICADQRISP